MRRIIIVSILTLTSLISASGQTLSSAGQPLRPRGTVLVRKLPNQAKGVTLVRGRVKLRPGYQFVKQENGTVTVARINGGGGVGLAGAWSCGCGGAGSCNIQTDGESLSCNAGTCKSGCKLTITVRGLNTRIVAY